MEASPIAQLTAVRLADNSAGQCALGARHWPQQQSTQMGPSVCYDMCSLAGWGLVPRDVAGGCFASAKSHLKSFVEQNGALSTLKRCT